MKTIGYLGRVDRLFDVPVTTRNWNTMNAIAKALGEPRLRQQRPGIDPSQGIR
jgi:hypothetical protein